jgi:hypothetical protein
MYLFSVITQDPFYVVRNLKLLDTNELVKRFPKWQSFRENMKEDSQIILASIIFCIIHDEARGSIHLSSSEGRDCNYWQSTEFSSRMVIM